MGYQDDLEDMAINNTFGRGIEENERDDFHFPIRKSVISLGVTSPTVMDSLNPKDILGAKKVSLSKLPPIVELLASRAMMNGAEKFGPYNWREKKVRSTIYIDAAMRHILAWFDGEEEAEDSKIHHLAHAIASLGIILDAQAGGNLVDDRPPKGPFAQVLKQENEKLGSK